MTTTPPAPVVERIARHFCRTFYITEGCWPRFETHARDILTMIREPTSTQASAGAAEVETAIFVEAKPLVDSAADVWRVMIDEARRA